MKVIRSMDNLEGFDEGCFVTIGIFDGVHLGHQRILKTLKKNATRSKEKTALLTFDPHPVKFFNPKGRFYEISTVEEKIELVGHYGVDFFVVLKFGEHMANMNPNDFVRDILIGKFHSKGVVVGYDFFFGKERSGDTEFLKKMGKDLGFGVQVIEPVTFMGSIVSSTRIRELVLSGRVKEAAHFLGRKYKVGGKVIHGAGRGKRLGYPTANIDFRGDLIPLPGVYVVMVGLKGNRYGGLSNVGFNPTFGEKTLRVEVNIIDFFDDIYGEEISLYFIDRIRDERKFASIDNLVAQMNRDMEIGKKILEKEDEQKRRKRDI